MTAPAPGFAAPPGPDATGTTLAQPSAFRPLQQPEPDGTVAFGNDDGVLGWPEAVAVAAAEQAGQPIRWRRPPRRRCPVCGSRAVAVVADGLAICAAGGRHWAGDELAALTAGPPEPPPAGGPEASGCPPRLPLQPPRPAPLGPYGKLVRDETPRVLARFGQVAVTRRLAAPAYRAALQAKLREEVAEYLASGDIEELADILEVGYALAEDGGITASQLDDLRWRKLEQRGGFEQRLWLVEVDPSGNAPPAAAVETRGAR